MGQIGQYRILSKEECDAVLRLGGGPGGCSSCSYEDADERLLDMKKASNYMQKKMEEMAENVLKHSQPKDHTVLFTPADKCRLEVKGLTENKSPLKDSGTRDKFSTGAVRDADTSKGRMDLVPMDIVGEIFEYADRMVIAHKGECDKVALMKDICDSLEDLVWYRDLDAAFEAFIMLGTYAFGNLPEAIMELSIHYRDGALKYAEHNWRRGIPLYRYLDSAGRHIMKWFRGDTDEPHARAFLWNIICYIWTVENFTLENEEIYNLPWCREEREALSCRKEIDGVVRESQNATIQ